MTVDVKIFPIAGLCNKKQELQIALEEGNMGELRRLLPERLGVNLPGPEAFMFLYNGRALRQQEDVFFQDGDQLWLLPQISGG